jgi:rod shape determining protein RodA
MAMVPVICSWYHGDLWSDYHDGDNVIQTFLRLKQITAVNFTFFIVSIVIGMFILLTDSKFFPATANLWYALVFF